MQINVLRSVRLWGVFDMIDSFSDTQVFGWSLSH